MCEEMKNWEIPETKFWGRISVDQIHSGGISVDQIHGGGLHKHYNSLDGEDFEIQ